MNYGYSNNNRRYAPSSFARGSASCNSTTKSNSKNERPLTTSTRNCNLNLESAKEILAEHEMRYGYASFRGSKSSRFERRFFAGFNSSPKFSGRGGYNGGETYRKLRRNLSEDEKESLPRTRFVSRVPKYTNMDPENLPNGYHTVKVSGLPKHLPENGLFNFFRCLGEVLNIYIIPAPAIEFTDALETYTAMITMKRYFDAVEIKRMSGRSIFGSRICVEFGETPHLQQKSSWKNNRFKKNNVFAKLPTEVLLKIFSHLDFLSRIRSERVCHEWKMVLEKNISKLPIAEGWPMNVKLLIAKNICPDQKGTTVKFDKVEQRLSLHLVTNGKTSFCVEMYNTIKKILPKIARSIVEVHIDNVEVDKVIIMVLVKYCSRDFRLTLNDVIANNMPLSFYQSFIRQYADRLTISPESPWPVHFIF